ncbi:MAG: sigma-70 family RNA polymerase sigma factor [Rickettsiales bacterium]
MTKINSKDNHCAELMRLALAGDEKAYAELLRESAQILRPYLAKRIYRFQDVEDVLQEILISLHKARHTYDGNRAYAPWLYAIAYYRLQDYLRKHYADPLRHAGEIDEAENISATNVTESEFSYESISDDVNNLSGKQPKILKMIHGEGYTAKEVAHKMGMSESAVKVAAHRAYKILRKKFNK